MKREMSIIVFWGAAWGIAEATLGYVLHLLPVNIGWLFWFPIAFYFMRKAYTQTNKLSSIIYISLIAAAIKLVNLLMPVRIDFIINPAVSIILESIVLYGVFKITKDKCEGIKGLSLYVGTMILSLSWRILYIVYVLFLPAYLIKISPVGSLEHFVKFIFLESTVNSLFIYLYLKFFEQKSTKKCSWHTKLNPIVSLIALCLAVLIQCIK